MCKQERTHTQKTESKPPKDLRTHRETEKYPNGENNISRRVKTDIIAILLLSSPILAITLVFFYIHVYCTLLCYAHFVFLQFVTN